MVVMVMVMKQSAELIPHVHQSSTMFSRRSHLLCGNSSTYLSIGVASLSLAEALYMIDQESHWCKQVLSQISLHDTFSASTGRPWLDTPSHQSPSKEAKSCKVSQTERPNKSRTTTSSDIETETCGGIAVGTAWIPTITSIAGI